MGLPSSLLLALLSLIVLFLLGPSPLAKKGPMKSPLPVSQLLISRLSCNHSVSNNFFSKIAHRIFMKLHIKLWCHKVKK